MEGLFVSIIIIVVIIFVISVKDSKKRERRHKRNVKRNELDIQKPIIDLSDDSYPFLHEKRKPIPSPPNFYSSIRLDDYLYDTSMLGKSEPMFEKFIMQNFQKIYIKGASLGSFTPDFALYDEINKIAFDIEIDEPYSLKDRLVIHEIGSDDYRNHYFTEKGWHVLKFSEDQIVTSPKSCIKLIAQIYSFLTITDTYNKIYFNEPDLICRPRWNYSEALNLLENKYREKYLSKYHIIE